MDDIAPQGSEWRNGGWSLVLGGAAGLGTSYGLMLMTSGLFIAPLQSALGVSRTAVTIIPVVSLMSVVLSPPTGWLVDRLGARRIGLGAMLALGACYAALTVLPATIASFYTVVALIGLVTAALSPMTWTVLVSQRFVRQRGAALALAMSGTSVLTALITPVLSSTIAEHGWRWGYGLLSLLTLGVGFPLVLLFYRSPPVSVADAPRAANYRVILAERRAWLLLVCFATVAFAMGGFMIHIVPILVSRGLSPGDAAIGGSVFAMAIALGRVVVGILLDKLRAPLVACCCLLVPVAGTQVVLLIDGETGGQFQLALLAASMLGMAQGAQANFIAFFAARYFPISVYARAYAFLSLGSGLMMAAGGIYFSYAFDLTGSYDAAVHASAICYLTGALLILFVDGVGGLRLRASAATQVARAAGGSGESGRAP